MAEKTINAKDVREGQAVTKITSKVVSRWRKRPTTIDQEIRKVHGKWPTVTRASFAQDGEGGQPTVYIEMSDERGWTFCLDPDDKVTVVA